MDWVRLWERISYSKSWASFKVAMDCLWNYCLLAFPGLIGLAYLYNWLGFTFEQYRAVYLLRTIPMVLLFVPLSLKILYRIIKYARRKGEELPGQVYYGERRAEIDEGNDKDGEGHWIVCEGFGKEDNGN